MRIFKDCYEMVREVERDLFEMGIKYQSKTVQDLDVSENEDFQTMELSGYSYKISSKQSHEQIKKMLDYMKISGVWMVSEFEDRIHPKLLNPGKAWKSDKELWERYLHNGEFEYTYNERMRTQLPYMIKELKRNPQTRQAIITIYDQHKDMRNWGGKARVPCSMHYQFILRGNKLHLIYVMRSCDFLKHFAGDVALALFLQDYVAKELGVEIGTFTHFLGSLHTFHGDIKERGIF